MTSHDPSHKATMTIIRPALRRMANVAGWLTLGVFAAGAGCSGIFDVEDPQAFGSDDLDTATGIVSVANGVEGSFQQAHDEVIVFTGLMSDELEDTSTWIDWADLSLGRVRGDWPTAVTFATTQDALLRARFAAADAVERFDRVLGEADAAKSPLTAQVKVTEAWIDLVLGMAYCEAPLIPGGPRAPDTELYKQAITKFTDALAVATAAASSEYASLARAGRARANLLAGNFDAALADAQAVPAGYRKQSTWAEGVATHWPGEQLHQNRNRSGGLRSIWFPQTDTIAGFVRDPWTEQLDRRMGILHPPRRLGVNNRTPHYSIEKYSNRVGPITITSKREMNLIEAEVFWRKNQFDSAIEALNRNRTTAPANLPAFTKAGAWTSQEVLDRLLSERFAELFVEGHRMTDLDRFNLVTQRLGPGRARKLPLSRNEILFNSSIEEGQAACPGIS